MGKSKIKKMVAMLGTLLIMTVMVGCNKKAEPENTTDNNENGTNVDSQEEIDASDDLNGSIVITGSTSVEKILNDMISEFTAYNPDVQINYTGTGSSAGISDTLSGANDIGVSSREVKEEEKKDQLKEVEFAYDGIAVVLHPSNKVTDLTVEQLSKIYNGEITNWKEVGGVDGPIVVVSREGASGTRSAFEELIGLEDAGGLLSDATVVEGNGNVQTTVANNENAIGYVSFSYIDNTVKAVSVNEVEPSAENAKSGEYSLSRPFVFVYMEDKDSDEVEAFLEFATGSDGQEFVEAHGGIRID